MQWRSSDTCMCEESCHMPSWSFCARRGSQIRLVWHAGTARSWVCIVLNAACRTWPLACPVLASSHCAYNRTPSLRFPSTPQNSPIPRHTDSSLPCLPSSKSRQSLRPAKLSLKRPPSLPSLSSYSLAHSLKKNSLRLPNPSVYKVPFPFEFI